MTDPTTPAQAALQNAQTALDAAVNKVKELPAAIMAIFAQAHAAADDLVATSQTLLADASTAVAVAVQELRRIKIEADASGEVDVTDVIQRYVDLAGKDEVVRLALDDGKYLVDAVKGISLRRNLDLRIHPNARIFVRKNDSYRYNVFLADETVQNTRVDGGRYFGDRDEHTYTVYSPTSPFNTHEQGHCVRVRGAQGLTLANMDMSGFTGDAVSIGGSSAPDHAPARDILLDTITATANRRQGVSIGNVRGFIIRNSLIADIGLDNGISSGTSPRCGIDIEPNDVGTTFEQNGCYDVLIDNVTIRGCQSYGFNVRMRVDKVSVVNSTIVENHSRGFMNSGGTNVDLLGGTVARNGAIGAAYAPGTSGKVAGVMFDRNVFAKHQQARAAAIVQPGVVPGTSNDLAIAAARTIDGVTTPGAVVDLSEANTYA